MIIAQKRGFQHNRDPGIPDRKAFKMINWLYSNSKDNKECFILGESGKKPLVCIGVNPSATEPDDLDNTLRLVKASAESLGYDSWIMINLYPQRATNPIDLHNKMNHKIHRENLKEIKKYLTGSYDIWAAWGTLIENRPFLIRCLKDIYEALGSECRWFIIGKKSMQGHPHHPLYLKKKMKLYGFDILDYIKKLS